MSVGERIGLYLSQNGIKQSFLAEKTGIPDSIISTIVNKGRKIEVMEYYKICKALNVEMATFIEDEE